MSHPIFILFNHNYVPVVKTKDRESKHEQNQFPSSGFFRLFIWEDRIPLLVFPNFYSSTLIHSLYTGIYFLNWWEGLILDTIWLMFSFILQWLTCWYYNISINGSYSTPWLTLCIMVSCLLVTWSVNEWLIVSCHLMQLLSNDQ